MLRQLNIANFALIKNLAITFYPGLNILSGETGAGKSIIINAVNLILGGRASTDLIRTGCNEARVEAAFEVPSGRALEETLQDMDIPFEGELIIRRTLLSEGRNRITINGALASLQMLRRLGPPLLSIAGQHEHQSLLQPETHLLVLDDFAGLTPARQTLAAAYHSHQHRLHVIRDLEAQLAAGIAQKELTAFQLQEIDAAHLTLGEDEQLEQERLQLEHAEELLRISAEGYQALYEAPASVLALLAQCLKAVERGSAFASRLLPICEQLESLKAQVEDTAISLRDFQQGVHLDPERLEALRERLELVRRLKRKHRPTIAGLLELREELAQRIFDLEGQEARLRALYQERDQSARALGAQALTLSQQRRAAARQLEAAVERELADLHMGGTRFRAVFEGADPEEADPARLRAEGLDRLEFMLAPNPGEDLRPLARIASGGELSRIMLVLKGILARSQAVETMIFDEVDAGISGATAVAVADKLVGLGRRHQVLCITHLPQIASRGDTHFMVSKVVADARTQTHISELDAQGRLMEIARLLGGKEITAHTLAHAREMLA